ncbi:hypothetical protein CBR_g3967 [Chara braunii]|uniref:2-methoxy-6-polyprenyl-1,4-benzoquinol methylase, mitochondrial n=1 Tax=Chara braunii TaxID=69332 RepID=A0A388KGX8_CHABU|nr:hypothetical protein CBR_g3967 [Chara braunii]|eukprot:GBG69268.1 hypothetical protein CBR_g3967 [Chara braunii]
MELARYASVIRRVGRPVDRRGITCLLRMDGSFSGLRMFSSSSGFPRSSSDSPQMTDFGYRSVPEEEKAGLVEGVFKNVADKYDLMNDLMSGGLHRLWKDKLVSRLRPFPGMQHLDAAGGTGDVSFRILNAIREMEKNIVRLPQRQSSADGDSQTKIVVSDINEAMLEVGKQRAKDRGFANAAELDWLQANAESLPLDENSFDGFTIAFGIRNCTHIDKVLSEAFRVLRRGGRFLCLEFSRVDALPLRQLYDMYSFMVIPCIGELVAGDKESYQYLVESIRRFPHQQRFARMIADAGFQKVQFENLTGGVVAIHSGFKL